MTLLFIFDMDDVLYDFDWHSRMAALTEHHRALARGASRTLVEPGRRVRRPRRGDFGSAEEYLAAFNAAIGHELSEDEWVSARGGAMTVFPESIAAVQARRRSSVK